MRIRRLFPLLAILAAAPAAAQQTQGFRSDAGYSLELPAQWARVPDEALAGPQATLDVGMYEVGYRAGPRAWPAPPIFGIARIDVPEGISQEDFVAAFAGARAKADMQAGVNDTPAAGAEGRVDAPRWDAENGIVWVRLDLESDGYTPAFAWTAIKRLSSGRAVVMLLYYGAQGEDEARVRADLLGIARSLREG